MKKVLWLIVCLMTMVVSVNAQSWKETKFDGDELLGTKGYVATSLSVSGIGMVVFYSDNAVKLVAEKGIFDYHDKKVTVRIGYYDENGELLKRRCETFYIGKTGSSCQYDHRFSELTAERFEFDARFEKNKEHKEFLLKQAEICRIDKGKEFVDFIRNNKGYVRFVAEKYGTNTAFDIKVPCMNE